MVGPFKAFGNVNPLQDPRDTTRDQRFAGYILANHVSKSTNDDVTQFIKDRGIKCHPLYYDENGRFHVERRLGCIGCPLKSDCGKSDYIRYPGMLKRLIISGKKYLDTHPNSNARKKFGTAYNMVFHNLFTKSYEDYQGYVDGLLPDANVDTKAFLEDYFKIDLTI